MPENKIMNGANYEWCMPENKWVKRLYNTHTCIYVLVQTVNCEYTFMSYKMEVPGSVR